MKKISAMSMFIATVLVFAFLMFISANTLKPQLDNPQIEIIEGKLTKTKTLQINPGESYTYTLKAGNSSINLSYVVLSGPDCIIIKVAQGQEFVCVDEHGNDPQGLNSTYTVPGLIVTEPWMLAVDKGWSWNTSTYLVFDGFKKNVDSSKYTFVREEYYKGRKAFVIKQSNSKGDWVWDWVDHEKRVLLREVGPTYEVELVEGLDFE